MDGDSLKRSVTDMLKGGDFRAREPEVYRLSELSSKVANHVNALGVPFACKHRDHLVRCSFDGVQVSRTFYSRGQTDQQLQTTTSNALLREAIAGGVRLYTCAEILDFLLAKGRAAGVVVHDLKSGRIHVVQAHAAVLATGGYGSCYSSPTLAKSSSVTAV